MLSERLKGKLPRFFRYCGVLLKWLTIAVAIGTVVGVIASLFGHVLKWATEFRGAHPWILLTLPLGGLLIVFLYHVCKDADDRGTNTVVSSIQTSGEIPFQMAPLIFVSTVITHLCGGSAGREGAAIQLGGSIAQRLGKLLRLDANDQRSIVMCGMSAGFSALFGTPMAAAVFSMEVVNIGVMHYAALVPCVTASLVAHFVADFMQVPPEVFPVAGIAAMDMGNLLKTALLAAVLGGVSRLFCMVLHKAEHLYEKRIRNQYIRIFVAGCLVIGLTALVGTDRYLGSGMGIIEEIFHTGHTEWYTFLLKMLFTAVTLGAGFKGGEIVPSFTVGAALGCVLAGVLHLPAELAAACGMIGLFCGVTNSPITSLLISFELFGYEGMPYYLITVAVSYMLSGYHSLYKKQQIMYSKTKTDYTVRPEAVYEVRKAMEKSARK